MTTPPRRSTSRNKKRAADSVGIATQDFIRPAGLSRGELLDLIRRLDADRGVHGVLIQLPLAPRGSTRTRPSRRFRPRRMPTACIPRIVGRLLAGAPATVPCTPAGCLEILDHYGAKLDGAEAVVIGR